MSWSSGHTGLTNDEVLRKVDDSTWHGVPPAVASAIKDVIYGLPEVPPGYQLVINTNGSLWLPPDGSPVSYAPSFVANIALGWKQIVVPAVANTANVAVDANTVVSTANGTSSNT